MIAPSKKPAEKRGRGRPKGSTGKHAPKPEPGVISDNESLRIQAFMERTGCSYTLIRNMIERGLKIRKNGKYREILGSDYHEYLRSLPVCEAREPLSESEAEQHSGHQS